jgi:hypothetical protein
MMMHMAHLLLMLLMPLLVCGLNNAGNAELNDADRH